MLQCSMPTGRSGYASRRLALRRSPGSTLQRCSASPTRIRGRADYDVFSDLKRPEAAELIDEARRFVETIEAETTGGSA